MLIINEQVLESFRLYLEEYECSRATIEKYMRDIRQLSAYCKGEIRDKTQLIGFKNYLKEKRYAVTSMNSMLAAVNRFLSFSGYGHWKLRYLRVQKVLFAQKDKELKRKEYEQMLQTAKQGRDKRLLMLLQTVCVTGIRISELKAITVESLRSGQARIQCKGKNRLILIPRSLCKALRTYCQERKIHSGLVFITRNGLPLDRSNIWRMMKRLAQKAKVQAQKGFPHNLRHLFACTYYEKYRDIVRLADILGHSSVNTTRIYTMRDTKEQLLQMEKLHLLSDESTT